MATKPEIQEFFVEGTDEDLSHVLLHIAEPVTEEEKERGYFFALIEISNSYPEQLSLIQELITDIESNYYTSPPSENSFEQVLQHINGRSAQILNFDNSIIHSIVGILQDRRLMLAYHGSPQASLFYQTAEGLAHTPIVESESIKHPQLFSTIVEGNINENDSIYICTPHVHEFFPAYRVKKIMEQKNARQSAMHIQKVLDSLNSQYSFGGILFHIPKIPITPMMELERKQRHSQQIGSQASMDNFLNTTRTTEETLSPPLLKNAKRGVQDMLLKFKQNKTSTRHKRMSKRNSDTRTSSIETNYRPSEHAEPFSTKILVALGRALVFLGTGLFVLFRKLARSLLTALRFTFFVITNRSGQRTIALDQLHTFIRNKKEQVSSMGIISKVLFIALICLSLIFVASITYLRIKEDREARAAQYVNSINVIIEKKDEAEARILYGEETKALEILQDANNMIDALAQSNDEEIATAQDLKNQLAQILLTLQKITTVETELVTNLTDINTEAQTQHIVSFDGKLFAFGDTQTSVYLIDPITKQVETKTFELLTKLISADVPKENDKIVFLNAENNVREYYKDTQSFLSKEISHSIENPSLIDLALYNTRIYALSAVEEQIFKHNPTQVGYDRGAPWISNKTTSLSDAVSLAIDGDLYILTASGKIVKFYAGKEQGFEINGLDPTLENPSQIWTYADVNNLYILEPTHKRVVIIDKEGNFVGQYTNEAWNDLRDFVINESDKTIYVLSGNKVHSFKF